MGHEARICLNSPKGQSKQKILIKSTGWRVTFNLHDLRIMAINGISGGFDSETRLSPFGFQQVPVLSDFYYFVKLPASKTPAI